MLTDVFPTSSRDILRAFNNYKKWTKSKTIFYMPEYHHRFCLKHTEQSLGIKIEKLKNS